MAVRRRIALLAAVTVLGVGATSPAPAGAAQTAVAPASHCKAGYVNAALSWGHKCLKAGQFCKRGNREYLRYGFVCPPSGHLRRR